MNIKEIFKGIFNLSYIGFIGLLFVGVAESIVYFVIYFTLGLLGVPQITLYATLCFLAPFILGMYVVIAAEKLATSYLKDKIHSPIYKG